MSSASTPAGVLPTVESGLTTDELFGVLSSGTRRQVLHALRRHGGTTDRQSLVASVGDDDQTAVELHHVALPVLERAALVTHTDDGHVSLTEGGWSVATWLAGVTPR
jgi:DNA-binding transcriptional ArsR family regulator